LRACEEHIQEVREVSFPIDDRELKKFPGDG